MFKNPPAYFVIFAVLCTSASSIFIRLSVMPPLVIAFYRMAMAAAMLFVPFMKTARGISRRDLWLCAASGLALALHFGTWIASLSLTSVAASTVLVSLSPIFVSLLNALIFRVKPSKILIFSLALALLGTFIISAGSFDGDPGSIFGNALALSGAFAMAVYLMLGAEVRKRVSTSAYAFLVYAFSAVFLLLASVLFARPLAPYAPIQYVNILAMALVCSIGGHTLYNMLLKHHGAALVSLATLAEPIFAGVLAVIILSEIPVLATVVGGVLAIAGVGLYISKK